jgi:hypothetical protein
MREAEAEGLAQASVAPSAAADEMNARRLRSIMVGDGRRISRSLEGRSTYAIGSSTSDPKLT